MIVAKYKFDKSIYENLIPVFNDGYEGYTVSDEIDSTNSNHIIRTIECDSLPTLMRFGVTPINNNEEVTNRELSLLEILDINTNEITTGYCMFFKCNNLSSINTENFNTSKVTNMQSMFNSCTNLISLDVSNFDTSKVTTMGYMFFNCSNLTSLDVSSWNTTNVTDMRNMFRNCTNLTSLDVSNFDTSNVTNMTKMFYNCSDLISLDLSNFDTSNVTNTEDMFNSTSELSDIGMLYCSQTTINKIIPLITDNSKTIWVKDTKASNYTATDYVTIKDYKEDNRTLYLNSPLLEGDEIVNKDGKLYHYHKMGMVVLDGSEDEGWNRFDNNINSNGIAYVYNNTSLDVGIKERHIICDIFKVIPNNTGSGNQQNLTDYNQILIHRSAQYSSHIYVSTELTVDKFKTMLNSNPMTLIYELVNPYYELISDDPLIVQSYAEGKLDTSSIITPTSIQCIPYEEELTYLYTSTQYCIQFYSTANCTIDITLGGTKVENKSVSVGLNKIYITTPSELVDNKLIINAKGSATISKVVVVNSNAEFDYFDGLKSSFEDCLVTDVDNENYGKYEVGVKIVGKNLFDKNKLMKTNNVEFIYINNGIKVKNKGAAAYSAVSIRLNVKPNTAYSISYKSNVISGASLVDVYDKNNKYFYGGNPLIFNTRENNQITIYFYCTKSAAALGEVDYTNIQIEEGTTATSYEPYKKTNATIYLNSPLLKGDRIEVVDGKLCHYHKMGSVVLDGSESWGYNSVWSTDKLVHFYCMTFTRKPQSIIQSDRFRYRSNTIQANIESIGNADTTSAIYITINNTRLSSISIDNFKQWLSENPTTIIYELAEPYYEDITPLQSSFVISTVSEGDMEIITDLPIKSNITYLTNIASAVLMEQQLDELDNSTESLTNIVEDEINE